MRIPILLLCAAFAGCTEFFSPACPAGLAPAKTAELFFGRNNGATEAVDDSDWQSFVNKEIASRFPDGFTVSDASGAWRGETGKTVRERTKLLLIVLKGVPDEPEKLDAIRNAYRTHFHQDSVLLFESGGCAGF